LLSGEATPRLRNVWPDEGVTRYGTTATESTARRRAALSSFATSRHEPPSCPTPVLEEASTVDPPLNPPGSLVVLLGLTLLPLHVAAQELKPAQILTVPPAEVRTTPAFEKGPPSSYVGEVPFLPGMDAQEYANRKAEASQQRSQSRGSVSSPLFAPNAPPQPDLNFEGLSQFESGGLLPPDTHGAIGKNQFVEIVNTQLAVFDTATGARLKDVSLATFFGYTAQILFDPRAVYDRTWNRWVVTAEAFPESDTVQFFFIGVSKTEDATGEFFIYAINVTVVPGEFFDFPQLGMDQDAVIITANIFDARFGTDILSIAKARLYNGLSLRIARFLSLPFNIAPPLVLDDHAEAFLINSRPGTANVALFALTNSSRPDAAALSGPFLVNVGLYNVPPNARQPGTTAVLDTLDARFQNASTQLGNSLFNIHTINFAGFATPRWYEIDTAATSVVQSGLFFTTATSDDFNPSITANDNKDVSVTWSATDLGSREDPGFFPQIRASGRLHTDSPGVIPSGSLIFQSPTFYTQFRWGDYSAITVDPLAPECAWGVNEKVNAPFEWGSRFFRVCFE
jgi:hypothetical protein